MAENAGIPKICLNMIVKNESRIITRLLDSVRPIIDCYLICDTGSTDNTKQLITEYFEKAGITGSIIDVPFKNFGYNRTKAMEEALKTSGADYILLLDADMKLVVESSFKKEALTAKAYHLLQKNNVISWWNVRMIHSSVDAVCVGPTHEYYDLRGGVNAENFPDLWIDDVGDGGCKGDKFDRDIRLLKEGLEESPDNGRYLFYLGNSYFNSNRAEESIPYYKKRIEVGGWYEEIWYSYYNLGFAYQRIGQNEQAIAMWLGGYEVCKTRSENIYEITKYYRIKGSHVLAEIFCKLGMTITYPKNEKLFIVDSVYDWGFDYEMSIIGYYTKHPNMDAVCSRVLAKTGEHSDNVLSNYKFYAKKILQLAERKVNHTFTEVVELNGEENLMRSCNPCIFSVPDIDGDPVYYLNIRMVNYEIFKDGSYSVQRKIATCNKMIMLDTNFKRVRNSEVLYTPRDFSNYYVGYEDVKIAAKADGKLAFVGTTQARVNGSVILTIHRGDYHIGAGELDNMGVLEARPVITKHNRGCEKNWALINGCDKVVYEWYPLTIGRIEGCDDASQKVLNLEMVETSGTPIFFKMLRGSSNGAISGDEVWFLCHVVDHDKPRFYYHCFVILDKESLRLKRWSTLMTFEGERIEFCIGLIVESERIIISHSTWDRTAMVSVYNREKLLNELTFFNA